MQIQINYGSVPHTPALEQHVETQVNSALQHHASRLTRIEVHLHDENGPRHGVDMRCVMEARPAGKDPIAVDAKNADMYKAVGEAAGKLRRAITSAFDKEDTKARRG